MFYFRTGRLKKTNVHNRKSLKFRLKSGNNFVSFLTAKRNVRMKLMKAKQKCVFSWNIFAMSLDCSSIFLNNVNTEQFTISLLLKDGANHLNVKLLAPRNLLGNSRSRDPETD